MPVVTAIERQKRRRRFDIHLDGAYAFSLSLDTTVESKIGVGDEVSDEERTRLEAEDQRRGAIASALRLLAATPRSERDLRDRLRRKGWRKHAVDHAMTRMHELGYLNDVAYARFYVDARQASTPRSRRALTFELGRKGVEREVAAAAVVTLSDADAAYDAAQRRLRALRQLDRRTFTRRLGSFLAARGFGYGDARAAIDRCWRELNEDAYDNDAYDQEND